MKTHTLDEVQDKLIGKKGTPERDRFEYELNQEMTGHAKVKLQVELPPHASINI